MSQRIWHISKFQANINDEVCRVTPMCGCIPPKAKIVRCCSDCTYHVCPLDIFYKCFLTTVIENQVSRWKNPLCKKPVFWSDNLFSYRSSTVGFCLLYVALVSSLVQIIFLSPEEGLHFNSLYHYCTSPQYPQPSHVSRQHSQKSKMYLRVYRESKRLKLHFKSSFWEYTEKVRD